MKIKPITAQAVTNILEPREPSSHKGNFGHVLVVGGTPGMSGAPLIAALGAARSGAGLVSIATHPAHAAFLNLQQPELMTHAINTKKDLTSLLEKTTVCVLGCGLGQDKWAQELFTTALKAGLPTIIDADGLNILAGKKTSLPKHCILTPHPGEAARLLNTTTTEIQNDRQHAIKALWDKYKNVIVLKGFQSLVYNGKELRQCNAGNPGMASGGMGDLLSGIIAGLLAQKVDLFSAANAGVLIHASAGDIAAKEFGERGLLATDLLPIIQQLVN